MFVFAAILCISSCTQYQLTSKARGENSDCILAKTLAAAGNTDKPDSDEHEEMAKGIGLVSYEGEHAYPSPFVHSPTMPPDCFLCQPGQTR